ncbi:HelD family protein [Streptomyces sp. NPDC057363]|uniref:HelD family protein n=1 Tax=Streptomyces sp. NPDC057363 TaxID=3346107 RepID=UPI0036438DDF
MTTETSDAHRVEADHLTTTLRRLERKIESLTEALEAHDFDYRHVKSYMADNRGEIDPGEMYQNELFLRDIDAEGTHAVRRRTRLEAMRRTPYFARLDFTPDTTCIPEIHYIGRDALQDAEGTVVVDWRSPLGGMYYEAEPGRASYEAPAGKIGGLIGRKRQLKIEDGRLRLVVDTSDTIRDDILLEEIGRTTDAHMRSIIATIQREQNAIIRNESDSTLVIQGVAGSGKTSIALHRIAYLLYRRRGRLKARNTAIVSPNGLFAEYVSEVLPELGEEPVVALDLAGVARTQLARHRLSFTDPLEPVDSAEPGGDADLARALSKATLSFHRWLEQAAAEAVLRCFEPRELRVEGCRVDAEELRERYERMPSLPVRTRLGMMAEYICQRDRVDRPFAVSHPRAGEVTKALTAMLSVKSARALYRGLFRRDDAPTTFRAPAAGTLEWADVYPFLFVAGKFDGPDVHEQIQHLVIDEMQDHSPTQYAVLRQIFPCDMTVLGDVGQALGNTENYTLDDLSRLFDDARVMELNRSYRSTTEIMEFAAKVRGHHVATIDRHGDVPQVLAFDTSEAETGWIAEEVGRFRAARSGRLAIVTRSRAQAQSLHRQLSEKLDEIALATADSRGVLEHDVTVLPVALAKGLEFDAVIVAQASAAEYGSAADCALLYIACTRALHRLTVTHTERPSPHLPA